MSLQRWLSERRLCQHESSTQEIEDLLRVVDRDLKDTAVLQISDDRRFAVAYNAILQLATIVLRAAGYRTAGASHHWITFQTLPFVMGSIEQDRVDYFDACRRKRNIAAYDASGEIAIAEVQEILNEAEQFRRDVLSWLQDTHDEFLITS